MTVSVRTSVPTYPSTLKLRKKKSLADSPVSVVEIGVESEKPQ